MRNHFRFRIVAIFLCALALSGAYHLTRTEAVMVETANRFLDSLTPEQKAKTLFEFGDDDRLKWHYFPENGFREEYKRNRRGITFKDMTHTQRLLAQGLLSSGLSQAGFVKAVTVMRVEDIVRWLEDDKTGHRDPENYHFSIFGKPSADATWAWRVEGHHLSLNFTFRNGRLVSSSPTFFGANPHEVPQGPHRGMRALAKEEDLARDLLKSFDGNQRRQAIFLDIAPYDIVTMASIRAKLEGAPQGLPASKMNKNQAEMLMALIEEYAGNMPSEVAVERMKAVRQTPHNRLYFGWAGNIDRAPPQPVVIGQPTTGNRAEKGNYYRVQGPTFLIEYDNTQNLSNHSHSVWRDFNGDFGLDVLALHQQYAHRLLAANPTDPVLKR